MKWFVIDLNVDDHNTEWWEEDQEEGLIPRFVDGVFQPLYWPTFGPFASRQQAKYWAETHLPLFGLAQLPMEDPRGPR